MNKTRQSFQSASRNLQESSRRAYEDFQRNTAPQIRNEFERRSSQYREVANEVTNRGMQQAKQYWENDGRHKASALKRTAAEQVTRAWNTYSPRAAQEMQNVYEQCAPVVVEKCSRAYQQWGETAGTRLAEYYRKYGQPAGDRLWQNMQSLSSSSREKIVEAYSKWGPQVGTSIKQAYDRYGVAIGDDLLRGYQRYGPVVGTQIKAAYEQWGPRVGGAVQKVYETYGTRIGERMQEAYMQFSVAVGEEIQNKYLPRIVEYASDEKNQKMAIETVGNVIEMYQNQDEIVYSSLKILSVVPIQTRNGSTTLQKASQEWIHQNAPFLKGTDIEEDPAKVITYCLIYPDKKYIFTSLRVIPNERGEPMTCAEKLAQATGADVEDTVETLELMASIEEISQGDADPETIVETSGKIQEYIRDQNQSG
ncbi:hypothetical protein JW906_06020 [bacterium]|nr:hypothetical protein [bacterium]